VDYLVDEGCFVFAADINEQQLTSLFGKNPAIKTIKMNVCKEKDVEEALRIVQQKGEKLFCVVNCAGILTCTGSTLQETCTLTEMKIEEVDPVFQVNLYGMMRVNRVFLPEILESKGCFINLSSILGRIPYWCSGAYSLSKYAVDGYCAIQRRELLAYGVRVIAIQPGFVNTPLVNELDDFSYNVAHTILPKTFEKATLLAKTAGALKKASWQSPQTVAKKIVRSIFTSRVVDPHPIIDRWVHRIGIRFLSSVPHIVVDCFFT